MGQPVISLQLGTFAYRCLPTPPSTLQGQGWMDLQPIGGSGWNLLEIERAQSFIANKTLTV